MKNSFLLSVLGLLGVAMMLSVVVLNSYIAFFVHSEYTGGMFDASLFWMLAGWILFYAAITNS